MRTCAVEGCAGGYSAKGYCGRHYKAWRKYGDPLMSQDISKRRYFRSDNLRAVQMSEGLKQNLLALFRSLRKEAA
jgi:hypothetical protein